MNDAYVAAMIWRLEHMTEAEHRGAAEQAGRMTAAIGRRWPRLPVKGRRVEVGCAHEGLTTI
jgi:hypothetical protein